jgi:hypothetical protein
MRRVNRNEIKKDKHYFHQKNFYLKKTLFSLYRFYNIFIIFKL